MTQNNKPPSLGQWLVDSGDVMIEFLPKDVVEGLREAHLKKLVKQSRIRVHVGDDVYPVLKLWRDGFTLRSANTPKLRGLVDLYDGIRHMSQCLIVASEEEGDLIHYEFKRNTATADRAARDFVTEDNAPIALLGSA